MGIDELECGRANVVAIENAREIGKEIGNSDGNATGTRSATGNDLDHDAGLGAETAIATWIPSANESEIAKKTANDEYFGACVAGSVGENEVSCGTVSGNGSEMENAMLTSPEVCPVPSHEVVTWVAILA